MPETNLQNNETATNTGEIQRPRTLLKELKGIPQSELDSIRDTAALVVEDSDFGRISENTETTAANMKITLEEDLGTIQDKGVVAIIKIVHEKRIEEDKKISQASTAAKKIGRHRKTMAVTATAHNAQALTAQAYLAETADIAPQVQILATSAHEIDAKMAAEQSTQEANARKAREAKAKLKYVDEIVRDQAELKAKQADEGMLKVASQVIKYTEQVREDMIELTSGELVLANNLIQTALVETPSLRPDLQNILNAATDIKKTKRARERSYGRSIDRYTRSLYPDNTEEQFGRAIEQRQSTESVEDKKRLDDTRRDIELKAELAASDVAAEACKEVSQKLRVVVQSVPSELLREDTTHTHQLESEDRRSAILGIRDRIRVAAQRLLPSRSVEQMLGCRVVMGGESGTDVNFVSPDSSTESVEQQQGRSKLFDQLVNTEVEVREVRKRLADLQNGKPLDKEQVFVLGQILAEKVKFSDSLYRNAQARVDSIGTREKVKKVADVAVVTGESIIAGAVVVELARFGFGQAHEQAQVLLSQAQAKLAELPVAQEKLTKAWETLQTLNNSLGNTLTEGQQVVSQGMQPGQGEAAQQVSNIVDKITQQESIVQRMNTLITNTPQEVAQLQGQAEAMGTVQKVIASAYAPVAALTSALAFGNAYVKQLFKKK